MNIAIMICAVIVAVANLAALTISVIHHKQRMKESDVRLQEREIDIDGKAVSKFASGHMAMSIQPREKQSSDDSPLKD